jgi:hypothetical protein
MGKLEKMGLFTVVLLAACAPVYEPVKLTAIAGGGFRAMSGKHCGLTTENELVCWSGPYEAGSPLEVMSGYQPEGKVLQLTGNDVFACYLQAVTDSEQEGQPYCWGYQVGGKPERHETPEPIVSLSTGRSHACGVTLGGKAYCVGYNEAGQLGTGVASEKASNGRHEVVWAPQEVTVVAGKKRSIAAGFGFTCTIVDEQVACWGLNQRLQLGFIGGPITYQAVTAESLPTDLKAVFAGDESACVVTNSGEVYCWGDNGGGQLAGEASMEVSLPIAIPDLPPSKEVALGDGFACALTTLEEVYCWGAFPGRASDERVVRLEFLPKPAKALAAYERTIMVLHANGSVSWSQDKKPVTGTDFVRRMTHEFSWSEFWRSF